LPKVQSPVKPLVSYQSYRQLSGWPRASMRLERPRVRDLAGRELVLPNRAVAEDWLGKWAMNLMLINVSTRKFRRAVRLPEGDVPAPAGAGVSNISRRLRGNGWVRTCPRSTSVAALGIDSQGFKHPLGLMEGATEHSAVVQALIDDLIERGLDPAVPRLFIIDGSKALAKPIRRSFGRHTPIQRCRSTRPGISWSVCRQLCMPRSGVRCAKPGNSTTPRRRRS
jgi:putative transposase